MPGRKTDTARNAAIVNEYASGQSLGEVADKYGVSRERVRQILLKNGVTERHNGANKKAVTRERVAAVKAEKQARRDKKAAERKKVRELYDAGATYNQISATLGCSKGYVQRWVRDQGGGNRNSRAGKPAPRHHLSAEQKLDMAVRYSDGEPVASIAADYGVSLTYVASIAYSLGYGRGRGPGAGERFRKRIEQGMKK